MGLFAARRCHTFNLNMTWTFARDDYRSGLGALVQHYEYVHDGHSTNVVHNYNNSTNQLNSV